MATGLPDAPSPAASETTMARNFKASDEGTTVVNTDGDEIGTIDEIRGNRAYVKPESGLTQRIRDRLDWDDENKDRYVLNPSRVDIFAGNKARLKD